MTDMGTTINSNVSTIDRRIDGGNGSRNFSTISSTATNLSSSSNDCHTINSNHMPKLYSHDDHSTVNSAIMTSSSGPIPSRLRRRQRISILKKLREKLANNNGDDFSSSPPSFATAGPSAFDSSPTIQNGSRRRAKNRNVLKIGVNGHQQQPPPPSTVSSSSRSSTMRSWRLVDEFFRGAGNRGRSAGAAGTAAELTSQQSTMSSCRSIFSNKTIIYDDKSLEIFKPAFCTIVNVDSSIEQQQSTNFGDQEAGQAANAQSGSAGIHASSNAESAPHNADAGQPPSSSVQLVGWRLRQDLVNDDECLEQNRSIMNGTGVISANEALNGRTSLLAPEDLPQIFANGWPLPPVMPNSMINLNESYDDPKGCCCTGYISHSFMIRIFIAVISLIGLSCVIVGTILGALTVSGSTRLTLCLLMIGVGVVLIIVSGIAWRLTSLDPGVSLSCWSILGLRTFRSDQSFYPDDRQSAACYRMRSGRHGAPYFSNLPSEFIWRPPPPTYQASVQEVRLQNIIQARMQNSMISAVPVSAAPLGSVPPPTYRMDHGIVQDTPQRPSLMEFVNRSSRPPSYSSRTFERLNATILSTEQQSGIADLPQENPVSSRNLDFSASHGRTTEMRSSTPNQNSTADNPSCSNHHLNSSDDDKQSLLRNDHLAKFSNENITSSPDNQGQISQQQHFDDSISVIDCSTAVPVIVSSGENMVAGTSCLSDHLQFDASPRRLTAETANGPPPPPFMLPPFLPMPHPTDYFPFRHQMPHFRPFGRPLGGGNGRSRLRQLPAHMQRGWPPIHFANPPGSQPTDGLLFPLRSLPPRVNVVRQSSGPRHQEMEDHHAVPPVRPTCYI